MTTHAAEPSCQAIWLAASLAFQDSLTTDAYLDESCPEPVTHRVFVAREEIGLRVVFDADVCTPHALAAEVVRGFQKSYVRKVIT